MNANRSFSQPQKVDIVLYGNNYSTSSSTMPSPNSFLAPMLSTTMAFPKHKKHTSTHTNSHRKTQSHFEFRTSQVSTNHPINLNEHRLGSTSLHLVPSQPQQPLTAITTSSNEPLQLQQQQYFEKKKDTSQLLPAPPVLPSLIIPNEESTSKQKKLMSKFFSITQSTSITRTHNSIPKHPLDQHLSDSYSRKYLQLSLDSTYCGAATAAGTTTTTTPTGELEQMKVIHPHLKQQNLRHEAPRQTNSPATQQNQFETRKGIIFDVNVLPNKLNAITLLNASHQTPKQKKLQSSTQKNQYFNSIHNELVKHHIMLSEKNTYATLSVAQVKNQRFLASISLNSLRRYSQPHQRQSPQHNRSSSNSFIKHQQANINQNSEDFIIEKEQIPKQQQNQSNQTSSRSHHQDDSESERQSLESKNSSFRNNISAKQSHSNVDEIQEDLKMNELNQIGSTQNEEILKDNKESTLVQQECQLKEVEIKSDSMQLDAVPQYDSHYSKNEQEQEHDEIDELTEKDSDGNNQIGDENQIQDNNHNNIDEIKQNDSLNAATLFGQIPSSQDQKVSSKKKKKKKAKTIFVSDKHKEEILEVVDSTDQMARSDGFKQNDQDEEINKLQREKIISQHLNNNQNDFDPSDTLKLEQNNSEFESGILMSNEQLNGSDNVSSSQQFETRNNLQLIPILEENVPPSDSLINTGRGSSNSASASPQTSIAKRYKYSKNESQKYPSNSYGASKAKTTKARLSVGFTGFSDSSNNNVKSNPNESGRVQEPRGRKQSTLNKGDPPIIFSRGSISRRSKTVFEKPKFNSDEKEMHDEVPELLSESDRSSVSESEQNEKVSSIQLISNSQEPFVRKSRKSLTTALKVTSMQSRQKITGKVRQSASFIDGIEGMQPPIPKEEIKVTWKSDVQEKKPSEEKRERKIKRKSVVDSQFVRPTMSDLPEYEEMCKNNQLSLGSIVKLFSKMRNAKKRAQQSEGSKQTGNNSAQKKIEDEAARVNEEEEEEQNLDEAQLLSVLKGFTQDTFNMLRYQESEDDDDDDSEDQSSDGERNDQETKQSPSKSQLNSVASLRRIPDSDKSKIKQKSFAGSFKGSSLKSIQMDRKSVERQEKSKKKKARAALREKIETLNRDYKVSQLRLPDKKNKIMSLIESIENYNLSRQKSNAPTKPRDVLFQTIIDDMNWKHQTDEEEFESIMSSAPLINNDFTYFSQLKSFQSTLPNYMMKFEEQIIMGRERDFITDLKSQNIQIDDETLQSLHKLAIVNENESELQKRLLSFKQTASLFSNPSQFEDKIRQTFLEDPSFNPPNWKQQSPHISSTPHENLFHKRSDSSSTRKQLQSKSDNQSEQSQSKSIQKQKPKQPLEVMSIKFKEQCHPSTLRKLKGQVADIKRTTALFLSQLKSNNIN